MERETMDKYYSDINLDNSYNSQSIAIKMIKDNSIILEFGPAFGGVTKFLNEKKNCKVYTVERDVRYAKEAAKHSEDICISDIEKYEWIDQFKGIKFDYILFMDILEHLHHPQDILSKSKNLLSEKGEIIISVPNIAHNAIIMELMDNNFRYSENGLLDKTHIYHFTYNSLLEMVESCGLNLYEMRATYLTPSDTEFHQNYSKKNNILLEKDFGDVYQFIIKVGKFYMNKILFSDRLNIKNSSPYFCQLFWDIGGIFTEEHSQKNQIELHDSGFVSYFDLSVIPKYTRKIRIDPIDEKVILRFRKILLKSKENHSIEIKHYNDNAIDKIYDVLLFNHNDPMIVIDISDIEINNFDLLLLEVEYIAIGEDVENYKELNDSILQKLKLKDKLIDDKVSLIKLKDREIFDKIEQLKLKDKLIDDKMSLIKLKEREIFDKIKQLSLKDKLIDEKMSLVKLKDEEISCKIKQLEQKDMELLHKNSMIKQKNDIINNYLIHMHDNTINTGTLGKKINNLQQQYIKSERKRKYVVYRILSPLRLLKKALGFIIHPRVSLNYLEQKNLIEKHGNFDVEYYLSQTDDVDIHRGNALRNFILHGWKIGLVPNKIEEYDKSLQWNYAYLQNLYLTYIYNCKKENNS